MTGGKPSVPTRPANSDRTTPWYERSFGDRYRLLYAHRDDASARREIDALVETMGLAAGCRVLDICCGAGRHLAALAAAGFDVWGVDLSEELLAEAAGRPGGADRLVMADMRRLPFLPNFDAAVNLFTSFGYFESDEENLAALRSMARCLKPGGVLALDHAHRDYLQRTLQPHSVERRGDVTVTADRRIENDRVIKHVAVTASGVDERFVESVRLYRSDEMRCLFERAGLTNVRVVGSFDGGELTAESDRMITLGQRA